MLRMASESPGEAIAKPASMMSTPRAASPWAMRIFSAMVMLQPGDCSPSRRVVSKKKTRSWLLRSFFWTAWFMEAPTFRNRLLIF
jgi:hypothetical protein